MKKIILIFAVLLLTGCDTRKCIESHEEDTTCVYSVYNGSFVQPIIVPCKQRVCDKYLEEENDRQGEGD